MCEVEVKNEHSSDLIQCRTCLSVGRKLSPLGSYVDVFKGLFPQYQYWQDAPYIEMVQICWECRGMLLKIIEFQNRVHKATEIIEMGQACIYGTLSNLVKVINNDDGSTNTIYNPQTYLLQIDTKPEIKDFVEDTGHISDDINNIDDTIENTTEAKIDSLTEIKEESKIENKIENRKGTEENTLLKKQSKFKIIRDHKNIFRKVKITLDELKLSLAKERDSKWYNASKYKCEGCVFVFKNKVSLTAHMKKYHTQSGTYTCDICSSQITKKTKLIQHIANHYYKYECVLCEFSCCHKEHTYSHRNKHKQVFQCVECELIFGHFKKWHEKYICDHCGVSFKTKYPIEYHMRKRHLLHECTLCHQKFPARQLWKHNKVHHTTYPDLYCVECDRHYSNEMQYRWHLTHSLRHNANAKRFPCPACDKIFPKKIYMKNHYDFVHLKKYKYTCELCDKSFARSGSLTVHRRTVHLKETKPKDKICSYCGRGFAKNRALTYHIRTHTGERPHQCPFCPAAFAQPCPLKKHLATIHSTKQ